MELNELLVEHGAFGLEKQDALSDFLGEHAWGLDLSTGTADFGEGRVYVAQVIGTESHADDTWLCAWANTASDIPPSLLRSANVIHELGARENVPELVEPELPLNAVDSHVLGLVASGVTHADAYCLGHHEHEAVLFLLYGRTLAQLRRPSVVHMSTIFRASSQSGSCRAKSARSLPTRKRRTGGSRRPAAASHAKTRKVAKLPLSSMRQDAPSGSRSPPGRIDA